MHVQQAIWPGLKGSPLSQHLLVVQLMVDEEATEGREEKHRPCCGHMGSREPEGRGWWYGRSSIRVRARGRTLDETQGWQAPCAIAGGKAIYPLVFYLLYALQWHRGF